MTEASHFRVHAGWGSDSMAEQLQKWGIDHHPKLGAWEQIRTSITTLRVHNISPPSETQKQLNRFCRRVEKQLVQDGLLVPVKGERDD